jgi:hypothetical protein
MGVANPRPRRQRLQSRRVGQVWWHPQRRKYLPVLWGCQEPYPSRKRSRRVTKFRLETIKTSETWRRVLWNKRRPKSEVARARGWVGTDNETSSSGINSRVHIEEAKVDRANVNSGKISKVFNYHTFSVQSSFRSNSLKDCYDIFKRGDAC